MTTYNKGSLGTVPGTNSSQIASTLIQDFSKKFYKVAPIKYPTASLVLTNNGPTLGEDIVRWGEKTIVPFTTTVTSGITSSASATAAVVGSTDGVRPGMYYYVPARGEIGIVASVDSSTTFTAIRGAAGTTGGAASASIAGGDLMIFRETPMQEGWTSVPQSLMTLAADKTNYIQRFVEPIKFTGTMKALMANGNLRYQQNLQTFRADAMEMVKRGMNQSLLYGKKGVITTGADGVQTTTGGLLEFAGTVSDTATDLSARKAFENAVLTPGQYSDGELMVACSATALQSVNSLYQANGLGGNYTGGMPDSTVGVEITKIRTPWGITLFPYWEPMLPDNIVDVTGTDTTYGQCIFWSPKDVKWRPVRPIGRFELPPVGDNWTEVIMAEGGWEVVRGSAIAYYRRVSAIS